jgi:hypothetical protein
MLLLILLAPLSVFVDAAQGGKSSQNPAGLWSGTYATEGGSTGTLSFDISKDEKNQWRGVLRFSNQDGEQTADLKSIQVTADKFMAKIESPDGQAEVAIEGQFGSDKFEGTYTVSPKGGTGTIEKGTWKTTKTKAK